MKPKNKTIHHLGLIALAFAGFSVHSAQAASQTWTNSAADLLWNTTSTNWTGAAWTNNNDAVYGATGVGSIAVDSSVIVNDITFNTTGYTLTGNLMLANDQASTFTLNADEAISAIIANNTAGASSLTKAGSGTLTLSGANTYTGTTNISGGTVSIAANNNLGTGAVTLDGGTLRTTAGFINTHAITIGSNGGTINNTASANLNFNTANTLLGSGTLTITGNGAYALATGRAGVVPLNNSNTYSGNVILQDGGLLEYGNSSALASGATVTVNNNGTLSAQGVAIANAVTVNSGGVLAFQNNGNGSFTGNITLNGSTTVRLQNWWSTAVQNGLISGKITGTGSLAVNSGTGTGAVLTLTNSTNDYTGGTTISGAILQLGNGGTTGSLSTSSGIILNTNGFLQINRSNATVQGTDFSGASLTGAGGFTQAGSGTTTLTTANTYTGATTVTAGALQLNNANAVQNSTVSANVANGLIFGSGIGAFNLGALAGTGAVALTDTASNAVTLNVGSNNASTTYSGVLSGAGGITKNGTGTLTFNASSTYSGATIVNSGFLSMGAAGSGPYSLANSDITVNSGAAFTFGGDTDTRNVTTTIGKSLTLNGGTAKLIGTFRSPTDVFTNNLALASGASILAVEGNTNGGFGSAVKFNGSLSRSTGATILFRGRNMGGSTNIDSNATGQPQDIFFVTAPSQIGGGGALNTTTTSIIAYALGDNGYNSSNTTSGLGTDFVSYNPSGGTNAGVQLLTTYASTITSGASALNNVKITDASATGINAATTINSLILNSAAAAAGSPGTTSVDGAGTLTINSGALMVTTTSPAASNGGSGGNYGGLFQNNATIGASGLTLDFGAKEGIITTVGTSTLTVSAASGGITGSGGLTKSGAGTLNLNAASTYTGGTTLNAGTLAYGNNAAFGTGAVTLIGGTLKAGGGFTLGNNISVSGAAVVDMAGNNTSLNGNISGSAALALTNSGLPSTLNLNGNNSGYTGTITFNNNNAVSFNSANAGSAGAAWVFNDANIDRVRINIAGGGTINFGSIAGGGQIQNDTSSTTSIISVGALNTSTTFGGTIKDNGTGILALTKVGTGTLTLSGANAYSGATTINSGTLALSNNNAAGTSAISLSGASAASLKITTGVTVANDITFSNTNASSSVIREVAAAGTYNVGTSGALKSAFAGGKPDTTASILAGTNSGSTATLTMSFSDTSSATNDAVRQSDVFSLSGTTATDTFVIQLSAAGLAADSVLAWNQSGTWVNAVTGNTGSGGLAGSYAQSFAAFLADNGGSFNSSSMLGAYGFDSGSSSVWAVVNHNSEFAAIPELSNTLAGLLIGAGLLRRRRN